MDYGFLLSPDELTLAYRQPAPSPALAFSAADSDFPAWRRRAAGKLAELLAVTTPGPVTVADVRRTEEDGVAITAVRMQVSESLSIPAYLLHPVDGVRTPDAVLVIHGHGEVEACLGVTGVQEDYHHHVARRLAKAGYTVLAPELRGFGALYDLAAHRDGAGLNYWRWGQPMAYTLVTDAFLYGRSLMGDTVEDLLRWEAWLAERHAIDRIHVVGISWGGDLACTYPVFSDRVRSIFASGTLGSFAAVFDIAGNAPAHCVPGILNWLDRADIAGLNAPTPIAAHYGSLDVPGPTNRSASYNETVEPSLDRLWRIYSAAGAPDHVSLLVSEGLGHELDLAAVRTWLDRFVR